MLPFKEFRKGQDRRAGHVPPRRRRELRWGFLALLLFGLGCGLLSRKDDAGPGVSKADYERSCGGCHKAYKPKLKTDDEWQAFLMEHRFLSGQDEETTQLFADYLKRNN